MDTINAVDPTEVIDAASELDAPGALDLFTYPALSLAFVAGAYDLARQLLTWQVATIYGVAGKLVKHQRMLTEKVAGTAAR